MGERRAYLQMLLALMARAPLAGAAKTRLIPALGEAGAAALHRALVAHAVGQIMAEPPCPVELWCAPDTRDPEFARLAAGHSLVLREQPAGELGERMRLILDDCLGRAGAALVAGTDCPALGPRVLGEALDALAAGQDAVLVPVADGGYAAIGLRAPAPWLFAAMPWGGPEVAAITRERLRARGWAWHETERLWDVDRPGDLPRLGREFPQFRALIEARAVSRCGAGAPRARTGE